MAYPCHTFNFLQAIKYLKEGHLIQQYSWNKGFHLKIENNGWIAVYDAYNKFNSYLSLEDFLGEDWCLVEIEYFDFQKAVKLAKEKKKIKRKKWEEDINLIVIANEFEGIYIRYRDHQNPTSWLDLRVEDVEAKDYYIVEE